MNKIAAISKRGVTSIHLHHFRCYEQLSLTTSLDPVVITGPNGAGKTNLLEALSFLIPGRGLRRARLHDVKKKSSDGIWGVSVKLLHEGHPLHMSTGLDPEMAKSERRICKINGEKKKSLFELSEYVTITWLTPQMDRFFNDTSSTRRRFLDRLVFGFDPLHARRLNRYEKVLRERSQLLKQGRYDPLWLGSLEDILATEGVAIAVARRTIVGYLNHVLATNESPFPKAYLRLEGDIDAHLESESALTTEDFMKQKLHMSRLTDGYGGGALCGPHRSDLMVTHLSRGIEANICSTGEQKALLLSIVLGCAQLQATYKSTIPLLLLDEVIAHLDESKRSLLFDELIRLKMQVWMTGTEKDVFNPLKGKSQFIEIQEANLASYDNTVSE